MAETQHRTTFREVFTVGEFRALWAAEATSQLGDQLLRVALALLVYGRTNSPLLTTLTYALTYIPTLLGGALLSGLADTYPRRTVMVVCDVVRAALVGLMALPIAPLWLLFVLLALTVFAGGPFRAAFLALLADVLHGPRYVTGLAIRNVTVQAAQLGGFALGGLIVALTGSHLGLAIDAATFLFSALAVWFGVGSRPATTSGKRQNTLAQAGAGLRLCWRDSGLRALILLSLITGLYIAPEGLAAPYTASIGHGDVATGFLMACDPVGAVIGGLLIGKWVSTRWSTRWIGLVAAASGLPLLWMAARPGLTVSMLTLALCGVLMTMFLVPLGSAIAHGAPISQRAQVMGLYGTAMVASQGVGITIGGVIAQFGGPGLGIALTAAAGTLLAIPAALTWLRTFNSAPRLWLGEERRE